MGKRWNKFRDFCAKHRVKTRYALAPVPFGGQCHENCTFNFGGFLYNKTIKETYDEMTDKGYICRGRLLTGILTFGDILGTIYALTGSYKLALMHFGVFSALKFYRARDEETDLKNYRTLEDGKFEHVPNFVPVNPHFFNPEGRAVYE